MSNLFTKLQDPIFVSEGTMSASRYDHAVRTVSSGGILVVQLRIPSSEKKKRVKNSKITEQVGDDAVFVAQKPFKF